MDELDLDAYLGRIGYHGPREPSLGTLMALHEAHVGAIPFENLDILLGRPILLHLGALQAKLVAGRRGGYCFEHNTLFLAVLERIGFEVTPLAARVRTGTTAVRPRTHMTLLVDLSGERFLSDVGFGGDGPLHPIPFGAALPAALGDTAGRLKREADLWVLEGTSGGDWTDLYAFTLERQFPVDYEMANHFTSTYPQSRSSRTSSPRGHGATRGSSCETATSPFGDVATPRPRPSGTPTTCWRCSRWSSASCSPRNPLLPARVLTGRGGRPHATSRRPRRSARRCLPARRDGRRVAEPETLSRAFRTLALGSTGKRTTETG